MLTGPVCYLRLVGLAINRQGWRWTRGQDAVSITAVAAILFALAARLFAQPGAHLWIDETFTGAIATQTTLRQVIHLAHLDAPTSTLYYVLMHVWTLLFGASDAALRAPSVICGLIAPLMIVVAPVPQLRRPDRLTWAALVALSPVLIGFSLDARSYALAVALATGQTIAYAWVMARPTARRAVIWIVIAVCAIEAHYDAAYLALAQGLLFLGVWRRDAIRLWPAALLVLPVIAELAWKWSLLSKFEAPGTAWYALLSPFGFLAAFVYPVGGMGVSLVIWLIDLPILFIAARLLRRGPSAPLPLAPASAAVAAVLGVAVIAVVGVIRPSFSWRYECVFIPGLALAPVLVLRTLARDKAPLFHMSLLIVAAAACAVSIRFGATSVGISTDPDNIEQASESLMGSTSKRILFAWDSPTARVMNPELLKSVGQFFFSRAGRKVSVIPVPLDAGEDPNVTLFPRAAQDRSGVIFLFDTTIAGTVARRHPLGSDPRLNCRRFLARIGDDPIGSVACAPLK
jgi:hypothetical protein